VVLGGTLRKASREQARAAIAGYSIGLDLSCRDLIQTATALSIDLVRGKAQDTMAPCGPWIVPAAFVPDPQNLRLQLAVNGAPCRTAIAARCCGKWTSNSPKLAGL
jgi:2-keto-4-pentenoate hydratase/2-oxohepta-3-ene-1,7-dioic acid hydratase in catechol pathway